MAKEILPRMLHGCLQEEFASLEYEAWEFKDEQYNLKTDLSSILEAPQHEGIKLIWRFNAIFCTYHGNNKIKY